MDFKNRLLQRQQEEVADENIEESENLLDTENEEQTSKHLKFFGIENVRNYPACLDLRLANGNSKALPYSYIVEINFDASNGIEITTASKKILITGRHLKMLYNYLTVFRVKYIQANIGNDLAEEETLFVKAITIDEL